MILRRAKCLRAGDRIWLRRDGLNSSKYVVTAVRENRVSGSVIELEGVTLPLYLEPTDLVEIEYSFLQED